MSVVEIRSAAAVDPVGNVVSVHEPTFRDDTGPSRITYEGGLASSHLRRPLSVDNLSQVIARMLTTLGTSCPWASRDM